ncbi:hypothetical protein NEOLEDRAFT_1176793 [Neolentinus lepideus HHB14362 ss-1]|uniref:Uncharacterized protein n=1 Tax=Neolentinus lepideus HHB14362 ss-1 TaxID=1314782 RepID=A0A165TYM8_9AGAM|nr:hypothetical protein NEOLEDRAFT_1176793 [Neolentinus lepideus HHB14362 ss-1]
MGRSAKLHKRVDKKRARQAKSTTSKPDPAAVAASSSRKANLKGKTGKRNNNEGHVLGGADYVDLMMGGRRRARAEAAKLPQDED